jgi:microcompartment protein CcmK/EutM
MRICEVIGIVTLSRRHPTLEGARLLVAAPLSLADLRSNRAATAEDLVIYDDLGAGIGSRVGVSEGAEAAMPFYPKKKPVDAYCACIVDRLHLEED